MHCRVTLPCAGLTRNPNANAWIAANPTWWLLLFGAYLTSGSRSLIGWFSSLGGMFCRRFCSSRSFWISRSNGPAMLSHASMLVSFVELGEILVSLIKAWPRGEDLNFLRSFLSVWQQPSFLLKLPPRLPSSFSSSLISSASLKLGDRLQFDTLLHSRAESLSFLIRLFSKLLCLSSRCCLVLELWEPLTLIALDGLVFGLPTNSKLAQLSPL